MGAVCRQDIQGTFDERSVYHFVINLWMLTSIPEYQININAK